jgi:prolyl-tRNA editing enzyme YbaK/EbsC (Cys-tRNA(Pro) deacylase)
MPETSDSPPIRPSIAARIEPVLTELRARGWDEGRHPLHVFDDGVKTAAAAAANLGCDVGAIANSLIFVSQPTGTPVLILTSGAHRVDTAKTATAIGAAELGRAGPDFVREHTGQTIGGVAPVGHPTPIPTYLDTALAAYPEIYAAAGHSHTVFGTTYAELKEITGATEITVN